MPKNQLSYTKASGKTLVAMGDSLTGEAWAQQMESTLFWPEVLAAKLRAVGVPIKGRAFGRGGETTTNLVARQQQIAFYEVPDLTAIYMGYNDSGASISQATTQANLETLVNTAIAAGCPRVLIINIHYMNFATAGDTTGTPLAGGTVTARAAQLAAVTARAAAFPGQVALVDVYSYMRNLILNGTPIAYNGGTVTVVQGDNQWHTAASNIHLNALGNLIIANAAMAVIQAQSGWLTGLQAG